MILELVNEYRQDLRKFVFVRFQTDRFSRRVFQVSNVSAFDGKVLTHHDRDGVTKNWGSILEREPEKRLPLLRKAADA